VKNGAGTVTHEFTVTVTVTLWVKPPLVAVTFTRYVPSGVDAVGVTVRVDVPEPPLTLVGLSVAVNTAGALAVRITFPEKPPSGLIVIELVPEAGQVFTRIETGRAVIVKSCTLTVTVVVWLRLPLIPVTVTV
jgi:hypothetical protein